MGRTTRPDILETIVALSALLPFLRIELVGSPANSTSALENAASLVFVSCNSYGVFSGGVYYLRGYGGQYMTIVERKTGYSFDGHIVINEGGDPWVWQAKF